MNDHFEKVWREVSQHYIGSHEIVEALMIALLCGGHVLLEGVPGIAKTTLARSFAEALGCGFGRIQFTMDLMPSDITGISVFNPSTGKFDLKRGPVFSNVLLADEINRAPAKTQSALMEAMQERQVTIDGQTEKLPDPFFVIATQNPNDSQGVYDLPEGEMDRFLFRIVMDYPTFDEEIRLLLQDKVAMRPVAQILSSKVIRTLREYVDTVKVHQAIANYIVGLVRYTRRVGDLSLGVTLGASPRASVSILRAAKARALLFDREYVTPDDVRWILPYALNHRIFFESREDSYSRSRRVIDEALTNVSYS